MMASDAFSNIHVTYNAKFVVPWRRAVDKIHKFNIQFHCEININEFRDFVENFLHRIPYRNVPCLILKARNIVNTSVLSFTEAKRGFSLINMIYSDKEKKSS